MRIKIVLLAGLSASSCIIVQAQENPATDSSKEVSLNEVTVSVTRFAHSSKSLAQTATVLSAKKIAFYSQPTTAELLTHSGSVFVQKSQLGGGSPVLRGFEANKIVITVDGIRMNNAVFRGGHLQNVITMDNSILSSTEILFGPSSVLYGSDALGGVLSFYTKDPALSTTQKKYIKAAAYARYSSAYNEQTIHADVETGGTKLASLTSFTYSDFGDLKQGKNRSDDFPNWGKRNFYVERINGVDSMVVNDKPEKQVQSGYKQYDFLQKFLFKTGAVQHVLNLQYSTSSDIYRYDRLTETNGAGKAKSAQWYYGPQKRFLAAWHIKLPASAAYDKATITPSYQDIEESRNNRNYRSANLNHRIENIKAAILNADFSKKIKQVELGYGAEITYNKVNSSAYTQNIVTGTRSSLDTRYPDGGSNTQSCAAYASSLVNVSEKFTLNTGLRFSGFRLFSKFHDTSFFPFPFSNIEQNASALSGNLGLVFLPGNAWKLAALFSTGFRTPNVDDMAKVFESGNGTFIVPNPNLKPEKTYNYELTVSKEFDKKATINVTGWYTDFVDILTTDFSTFNGSGTILYNGSLSDVVTIVNKNKAFVTGFSANLNVNFCRHMSAGSVITYTYGRIKESPKDYPLDHVPPTFGKTFLAANYGKFSGELFALYQAAKNSANYNLRGEDNQQYSADPVRGFTPAWITANLRTAYQFNKHVGLRLAVENIFDQYYRVFGSGLSAPGRNFSGTVRVSL